jgi:UDP-N-acetylglucosamine--N-acetylmuramyl-(pentapeptide) pyrophosphoryl-undecaprenol N-acetylglucosamine transferase
MKDEGLSSSRPRPSSPQQAQEKLFILWIGGVGGMEADLVKREGIPFEAIPAAGVHGVGLRALPRNLWQLGQGFLTSRRILRRFQPDVLLFTGGFIAAPMGMAARLPDLRTPRPRILLYIPDIEPGWALKALTRFADHVAITDEESRGFFSRHTAVTITGYPVRPDLRVWDRTQAYQTLGLNADLPTLLVYGGSKGARTINQALIKALPELLAEMQIIHITGRASWPELENSRPALPPEQTARYHAYPYLHEELGAAMSVADLMLSRAGASTLGELPMFGLPAVLVPYPYAWRYQRVNADYLAKSGAAVVIENTDLPAEIIPVVRGLMSNPQRRNQMRQAMSALYHPQAAQTIANLIKNLSPAIDPSLMKDIPHG